MDLYLGVVDLETVKADKTVYDFIPNRHTNCGTKPTLAYLESDYVEVTDPGPASIHQECELADNQSPISSSSVRSSNISITSSLKGETGGALVGVLLV